MSGKLKIQNTGYAILFGMLLWPVILTVGPKLEGRLNPVVVGTDLTRVLEDGETHSLIYGKATRLRECDYIRMEWYYGEPDGRYVLVPLEILERSKIRDDGEFEFGPWRLNLQSQLVKDQSFALVYHRCHPFFETVTEFWP